MTAVAYMSKSKGAESVATESTLPLVLTKACQYVLAALLLSCQQRLHLGFGDQTYLGRHFLKLHAAWVKRYGMLDQQEVYNELTWQLASSSSLVDNWFQRLLPRILGYLELRSAHSRA